MSPSGLTSRSASVVAAPAADCGLCPRLSAFREGNRERHPGFHNAPVPSFGGLDAWLLIVGLAPGLKGANQTGRPFTGDFAGDLLYDTLLTFGLAEGSYGRCSDDGLRLVGCRITNAVRCVPPENKPVGAEIKTCLQFLKADIAAMANLRVILSLGLISHGAVLSARGLAKSARRFGHGAVHQLPGDLTLVDSYHCSRYNTNTRRLTPEMFAAVFSEIKALADIN